MEAERQRHRGAFVHASPSDAVGREGEKASRLAEECACAENVAPGVAAAVAIVQDAQ